MERTIKNYFSVAILAVIWGSSFILMKRGLEVFNYMQVANARIFIAFITLIPLMPKAFKLVKRRHFFPILITALLGNGIPAILFAKAQTYLDSSFVGILNSSVPLFTIIIGFLFFKIKPNKANVIGVLVGLLGVLFLTINSLNTKIIIDTYIYIVILGTIFYAVSMNVIKNYLQDLNASSITAIAFLIIGPFSFVYLSNTDFLYQLNTHHSAYKALGYIALLSIFGTSMASIIFNKLLNRSTAIFTSSITYLIPIVAIFWGVIDGEIITINHIVGFIIILCGVYLVNRE